jgi:Flp pilus assembly protein TadG
MVLNGRLPQRLARVTRRREERGAIIVVAALMMTALLGMSAIAIDITNARQQQRQAQGSADAAALAAAQDLPDPNAVVATAKEYAADNFDTTASAWSGCQDPDHLAELPDAGNGNSCISIDEAFSRVRVRIPNREVSTYFAKVLGVDTVPVSGSATAEAKLTRDDRIIPATVAASTGSGWNCIENGGANVAPCNKSVSGNFGSFDAPRLNLYEPTSQVENNALRINYSMGVDHVLSIYGTGSTKVCDYSQPTKSPCTTTNVASGKDANHLLPFTGNVVPPLTDGLIDNATISTDDGDKLFCGRLRRPDLTDDNLAVTDPENCQHWADAPGPGPAITVVGEKVNGRHVAYWMKSEYRSIFYPSATPTATASTSSSWATGDTMLNCFLESYRFDYGGTNSKGHAAQTEFFINPASTINTSTADGTEFSLVDARNYLVNTCKMPAATVDAKLTSLTDSNDFWPMFEADMVTDPRFGMIPVVTGFNSGSSTAMQIVRFWGIYMYKLHATSTKVQAVDSWVFEPALVETESGIADLQFGYQSGQAIVRLVE